VVANKVLKDINKIVREEQLAEKNEKYWIGTVVFVLLVVFITLLVLIAV